VAPDVAASMARERVLVIASGTQAERMSALTRLAAGTHPQLRLDAGDTVILSSRIIPGNDRPVFDMMADLLRLGVHLHSRITDRRVHTSGHAHRDEQRRMIELTRPRAFLPLHGTLHHLMRHAELARECSVGEVMVAENGEVIELSAGSAPVKAGRVPVGKVATAHGDELSDDILRERAQLGRGGVAFVSVLLDARGQVVGTPQVVSRGVLEPAFAGVARNVAAAATRAIAELDPRSRGDDDAAADAVRLAARRAIESHTGRRPTVLVAVSRP
jgi:ribonuclease J